MEIFVSRRGLEKRRDVRDERQLAIRGVYDEISSDGTAIWRDPSIQSIADQVVGAHSVGFVGLAYGMEILIEDTEEYLHLTA